MRKFNDLWKPAMFRGARGFMLKAKTAQGDVVQLFLRKAPRVPWRPVKWRYELMLGDGPRIVIRDSVSGYTGPECPAKIAVAHANAWLHETASDLRRMADIFAVTASADMGANHG